VFEDKETIEDFVLRMNGMVAHLPTLGEVVKQGEMVMKILHTMPPCFKKISIAIKTLFDVLMMTVADLIGRLNEA
jgi:hypothetical protein